MKILIISLLMMFNSAVFAAVVAEDGVPITVEGDTYTIVKPGTDVTSDTYYTYQVNDVQRRCYQGAQDITVNKDITGEATIIKNPSPIYCYDVVTAP